MEGIYDVLVMLWLMCFLWAECLIVYLLYLYRRIQRKVEDYIIKDKKIKKCTLIKLYRIGKKESKKRARLEEKVICLIDKIERLDDGFIKKALGLELYANLIDLRIMDGTIKKVQHEFHDRCGGNKNGVITMGPVTFDQKKTLDTSALEIAKRKFKEFFGDI